MTSTIPLIKEDCESGEKEYDDEGIENDFAYRNNVKQATKAIRLKFIRKVYGLLTAQLFLTFVIATICMYTPPLKGFIQENQWLTIIAMFATIGLIIALHIKRKETPINFILLTAFTVVEAYTVGVLITFYSQAIVLKALVLTIVVLAALTLYTFQTKKDYSSMHSGLFACLCILLVGSLMQLIFYSSVFEMMLSIGGALLFCMFIVVDTQMLMETLSPEEYILATINLYLDIINLFVYILRILQALDNQ